MQNVDRSRYKILLVEDDVRLRTLFEKILESAGFSVEVAGDGEKGFQKAKDGGYAMIISDIIMPVVNGIEMLSMLKQSPPLMKNGPIVMLSNVGDEGLIQKAISLGALGYVEKTNLESSQLVKKVCEVLGIDGSHEA
jgi:CheY-like chemotaxis protein